MIRKIATDLLRERELLKSFKTDLMCADIFRLENISETSEAKCVDFGNSSICSNIVGILNDDGKKFYPLFTDEVYIVKKTDHIQRFAYDSLNKEDIGGLFILSVKKFDVDSLKEWEKEQYYKEYKRLKIKLSSTQNYKEKCNLKLKH